VSEKIRFEISLEKNIKIKILVLESLCKTKQFGEVFIEKLYRDERQSLFEIPGSLCQDLPVEKQINM